jgi:hypothetical protein
MMQTPPVNSLTTPVALVIVALAMVISTLIFVFAGNSQTEEQASGLAKNSVDIVGSPPEYREFDRRHRPNFERHARPNLGKLRAFMARSKRPFSGNGKPGLDGERQGNTRPPFSGKGKPG